MQSEAKEGQQPQKLEAARHRFSPEALEAGAGLTPSFQTSDTQSSKRINFYCLKPSSLWHSLMAALGNKFNTHKKFFSLLHFTCVSKLLNLSESQFSYL